MSEFTQAVELNELPGHIVMTVSKSPRAMPSVWLTTEQAKALASQLVEMAERMEKPGGAWEPTKRPEFFRIR